MLTLRTAWLQGDGALVALPGDADGHASPETLQAIDNLSIDSFTSRPCQEASAHSMRTAQHCTVGAAGDTL